MDNTEYQIQYCNTHFLALSENSALCCFLVTWSVFVYHIKVILGNVYLHTHFWHSYANYHVMCCYMQAWASYFSDLQMEHWQLECGIIQRILTSKENVAHHDYC